MNHSSRSRSFRCLLPTLVMPIPANRLTRTAVGTVTLVAIASLGCSLNTATRDQSHSTVTKDQADPTATREEADSTATLTLTASQIIDRMAETYSNCSTYRDTGTVQTIFKRKRGTHTVVKRFSTAMIRPNRFRFEYIEEGMPNSRYVVWRADENVQTWSDVTKKAERGKSLRMALAGATGVSSGSAHTIPALLMPDEVGGRRLTDLKEATRGDDRHSGTHKCFTIEGLYAHTPITIWIDQESFLVRRIDRTSEFEDFSTATSTTYEPVIDEDVPPGLLDYNAPEQGDGEEGIIVERHHSGHEPGAVMPASGLGIGSADRAGTACLSGGEYCGSGANPATWMNHLTGVACAGLRGRLRIFTQNI